MHNFKVGDKVRRINGSWRGVEQGDVRIVSGVGYNHIRLEGVELISGMEPRFDPAMFELAEDHKKLINSGTNVINNVFTVPSEEIRKALENFKWEAFSDKNLMEEDKPMSIDSHYDFFYDLKPHEAEFLQIKTDPYFVSKQWRVGERDPSGALFHILKTIARFGDKNPKEREIKAIYLQIKRLAELEGVELE
jgi:hypothetical protein